MFNYPFNIYGWHEFTWRYYYIPKYKLQLFWRLRKISYCNFDIVESVNEILFAMFCHWFETSKKRYIELDKWNRDDTPNWVKFETMENIYKYIKYYRINNKQLLEHLYDKDSESCSHSWIDLDNGNKRLDVTNNYFLGIKVSMNEELNFLKVDYIKKIEKESKKKTILFIYDIEDKLNKWDDIIAKKIIEVRHRLWI